MEQDKPEREPQPRDDKDSSDESGNERQTTSPHSPRPSRRRHARVVQTSPLLRSATTRSNVAATTDDDFLEMFRRYLHATAPTVCAYSRMTLQNQMRMILNQERQKDPDFTPSQWMSFGSERFLPLRDVTDYFVQGMIGPLAMLRCCTYGHLTGLLLSCLQKHKDSGTVSDYKQQESHLNKRKEECWASYQEINLNGRLRRRNDPNRSGAIDRSSPSVLGYDPSARLACQPAHLKWVNLFVPPTTPASSGTRGGSASASLQFLTARTKRRKTEKPSETDVQSTATQTSEPSKQTDAEHPAEASDQEKSPEKSQ